MIQIMQNVGTVDRSIRVAGGVALFFFFALGEGAMRHLGWLGVVPFLTGMFGYCPLYHWTRFSTCGDARRQA